MLALAPLRGLGVISYGVYLWHWPLYMVLTAERAHCSGYELFGLRVLATLAVATVSYHLIEKPLRRGAFRQWKVSWSFAPAVAAVLVVALLFVTRGAVSPMAAYSVDDTMPEISRMASMIPTRVLMLGDSVALSMGPGFDDVSNDYNMVVWDHYHVGCGFLPVDAEYDFNGDLTPDARGAVLGVPAGLDDGHRCLPSGHHRHGLRGNGQPRPGGERESAGDGNTGVGGVRDGRVAEAGRKRSSRRERRSRYSLSPARSRRLSRCCPTQGQWSKRLTGASTR